MTNPINEMKKSDFCLSLNLEFHRENFQLNAQMELNTLVTGLVGTSGSGKSTLLALIAGLLKPTRGSIQLNQRTLFDSTKNIFIPAHQRRIGLVFQDKQLFPHFSVKNNLLYGFNHCPDTLRRFSLEQVVELLELESLLNRKPQKLSGGEQQRVALGRALLYSPELLLLDEPLSALDTQLKEQILPFLGKLRDLNLPMIYVSHAKSEIDFLTAHCLTMSSGKLISTQSNS